MYVGLDNIYEELILFPTERGLERIKDYRRVAVVLKRTGDVSGALNYLKLSKELEIALGGDVNVDLLEQFPPVPKTLINPSEIPLTQVPTKLIDQHQSHSEGMLLFICTEMLLIC